MSRLEGPGTSGQGASSRDRFATSRVVTAILFGAGGVGAAALHIARRPDPDQFDLHLVYVAAAISAVIAAWRGVGTSLGRGLAATTLSALASAVAAGLLFSLIAGVKAVIDAYRFTHFSTADAMLMHLLSKAGATALAVLGSPALFPALLAAVVAGLLGEAARRAWDRVVIAPT